ncbi:MAG: peptidoglycan D,D-transpeptidase FtsI family protein [Alphaproteobacteria bacterium]
MRRGTRRIVVRESTGRRLIEQSRIRLLCVGLFFLLCLLSISYRMIDIAVVKNEKPVTIWVTDLGEGGRKEPVKVDAGDVYNRRGNIVDRNGVLLATSLKTASLYANPREIRNPREVAAQLRDILGLDTDYLLPRLQGKRSFVWIKRDLPPSMQQEVNTLGVPGLYFRSEGRRVYPYGNITAHLVGYVGVDDKGLAGMEKSMDTRLRRGADNQEPLALSIDIRLQAMLREEMQQAMTFFKAVGAAGVIYDIKNDEILSMVSLPDFDPHRPGKASKDALFNRVSLGVYEMGSTFKTFTMAAGLEHQLVNMKSGYDATKPFKISSYTIRDAHPEKRWLSVPEIYAYSSNIGTAKLALDIGGARQRMFLRKLGLMDSLEVEIPEKANPLYPSDWKDIHTVTISYGHGISVTPLHLVRAVSTLVGSGRLPHMSLVKEGNKSRQPGEEVVSEQTRKNVRRLMRLVVSHGTGRKSHVPGYRVGGKTGTAEKVGAVGKYEKDNKLASFLATFPMDDPQYVVLVMVDGPKGNKETYGYATGGWVSAPVVGNVISRMGPLLGIAPRYDVPEDDADKFWVSRKKEKQSAQESRPNRTFYHAATY